MVKGLLLSSRDNFIEQKQEQVKRHAYHDTQYIQGPKSLDDKIAIVGAGPAGIHMAVLLKDKGFKNIDIYERDSRIGGKSMTVFHNGAPQEMGSCCFGPGYENNVMALIKRFAPDDMVPRAMASVWLDNASKPILYVQYIVRESMKYFQTTNSTVAVLKLVQAMKKYIAVHKSLFGDYDFELMPRPSPETLAKCKGNFLDFLKRHNVESLASLFIVSHTLQGYDYLDRIGAFYGLMWNPPSLINGLLKIVAGDPTPRLFLTKRGFQKLWETIARKSNLRIHFNRKIRSVKRSKSGILICRWESWNCYKHDFVIWSPEMKRSLKYFDPPTRKEKKIFRKLVSNYMITSLVDVIGGKRASTDTEYFLDNISKKREKTIWAVRDSYESLHGGKKNGGTFRSVITYQSRSKKPCVGESIEVVEHHFKERNAYAEVVKHEIWKYFPHFPTADTLAGILWDILEMQGNKKTWYIGSSVSYESLKSVIEYNKLLVSKMRPIQ
eukprot:gene7175-7981_t